jgi:hypothetical protein
MSSCWIPASWIKDINALPGAKQFAREKIESIISMTIGKNLLSFVSCLSFCILDASQTKRGSFSHQHFVL